MKTLVFDLQTFSSHPPTKVQSLVALGGTDIWIDGRVIGRLYFTKWRVKNPNEEEGKESS